MCVVDLLQRSILIIDSSSSLLHQKKLKNLNPMYILLTNLFGNLGDQSISVLILFIQNAKQPYVFFQSPGEKKNQTKLKLKQDTCTQYGNDNYYYS